MLQDQYISWLARQCFVVGRMIDRARTKRLKYERNRKALVMLEIGLIAATGGSILTFTPLSMFPFVGMLLVRAKRKRIEHRQCLLRMAEEGAGHQMYGLVKSSLPVLNAWDAFAKNPKIESFGN